VMFRLAPVFQNQRVYARNFRRWRTALEAFALLGCYSTYAGSRLPTFRYSLLVPSSRVK
jgi:hypothetical protein